MPETAPRDNRETFDAAAATLAGDIRQRLRTEVSHLEKPWTKMKEHEQRRVGDALDFLARDCVRRTVGIVASVGFPSLVVQVGKWTVKDGEIKAEFTLPATEETVKAVLSAGRASLVLADADKFMGEREAFVIDPDQVEMFAGEKPEGASASTINGEVIHAGAPDEVLALDGPKRETPADALPLDVAEAAFTASKAKAEAKAARKTGKGKSAATVDKTSPEWLAAVERGRNAFLARQGGIVPDDLAGTPLSEGWLDGWATEQRASTKRNDAPAMPKAPAREPA